jgi:3-hydroxybutyryl-CoA dehydrogenase
MKKEKVIIIGAGKMGAGIAAVIAAHGSPVVMIDTNMEKAQSGVLSARRYMLQLMETGLLDTVEDEEGSIPEIIADTGVDVHLSDTWLIIEAVFEDLHVKQSLFRSLDKVIPEHIIIASNTSGMMLSMITEGMKTSHRTVITHFWYPGHLVPLVEVVRGAKTEDWVIEKMTASLSSWGKAPVVVNMDLPGQLANRILQAIIREASHIVGSGLASAEDVDTAIKMGMALRFPAWGPLEHIDAVGLDLAYSVQKDVLPGLNNDSLPSEGLKQLVHTGNLGVKTGKGFYDWNVKNLSELEECRDECIISNLKLLKNQSEKRKIR